MPVLGAVYTGLAGFALPEVACEAHGALSGNFMLAEAKPRQSDDRWKGLNRTQVLQCHWESVGAS